GELADRLRQRHRPLLQLLEEPRVLDGDDGLVGEGLEKSHLLGHKGLGLRLRRAEDPNDGVAAAQWYMEKRAVPLSLSKLPSALDRSRIALYISCLDRCPGVNGQLHQATERPRKDSAK